MIIRKANEKDLQSILNIYNQGIEDRIATLETDEKDLDYMRKWLLSRSSRQPVLLAEDDGVTLGWASINSYNIRRAYDSVGDISVYIERTKRGKGVGQKLLKELETEGKQHAYHKFVLMTLLSNIQGQSLYRKLDYREVGILKEQGILDGKYVDIMIMEKILAGP
ncbi:arsinothricin resistance N-acetyltransferase ArsN1 family A [Brevibacillus daliensis]|uniref:arsinothricin resistance N-acetyltransferase ArsN1 family A n=1 Tax=Brevibacillus daliensis TaxID=2892995 RepID=UPI001E4FCF69|nr:arsinothricin resistance N-acetyltransferase ArsN1 family A [Brevibacillus daliensis]